jgi:hypothetical protein
VTGDDRQLRRPSDVQGLDVGGFDVRVAVEEPDCVLASVAREVSTTATSKWDGDQLIVISAFWDAALQAKQLGLRQ